MAFHEAKECCKGHQDLNDKLHLENVNYIGRRHASRLMSDAYGKGIVRGQVECANLRAYSQEQDVAFAESFRTAGVELFYGRDYLEAVEQMSDGRVHCPARSSLNVDARNKHYKKVTVRDMALFYGQRPKVSDMWHLSPYEFVRWWKPVMLTYPQSLTSNEEDDCHAALTSEGEAKLAAAQEAGDAVDLIPGTDYEVKEGDGSTWVSFPDVASTKHFRHVWILQRRKRPVVPCFGAGAPVPSQQAKSSERNCRIIMTYLHPWTMRKEDADAVVSHAAALKDADTWEASMVDWFRQGVASQMQQRFVYNCLNVFRCRPKDDDVDDARSEDMVSDEELEVEHEDLVEMLQTRIGGHERCRHRRHGRAG